MPDLLDAATSSVSPMLPASFSTLPKATVSIHNASIKPQITQSFAHHAGCSKPCISRRLAAARPQTANSETSQALRIFSTPHQVLSSEFSAAPRIVQSGWYSVSANTSLSLSLPHALQLRKYRMKESNLRSRLGGSCLFGCLQ